MRNLVQIRYIVYRMREEGLSRWNFICGLSDLLLHILYFAYKCAHMHSLSPVKTTLLTLFQLSLTFELFFSGAVWALLCYSLSCGCLCDPRAHVFTFFGWSYISQLRNFYSVKHNLLSTPALKCYPHAIKQWTHLIFITLLCRPCC